MSWNDIQEDGITEVECRDRFSSTETGICRIAEFEDENLRMQHEPVITISMAGEETHSTPQSVVKGGEFIGPWLPPKAKQLINELQQNGQLSPNDLLKLMDIVSKRAIEHFELPQGRFLAITITGRIAESADNKIELLRKTQGNNYSEPIFLWKVGSDAFSGRL
jgi:hypothetical protein